MGSFCVQTDTQQVISETRLSRQLIALVLTTENRITDAHKKQKHETMPEVY